MKKIWNKIRNIVCKKQTVEEKSEATATIDAQSFTKQLGAWCKSSADGEKRGCLLLMYSNDGETTISNGLLHGSPMKLAMIFSNRISEDNDMHEIIQRAMTLSIIRRISNHK